MKVSTEGPSCMAVAVACHNRVMIELYDCQTEDIKLIHMIENIGAMRIQNSSRFSIFPAWPGVRLRPLVVVRTCKTHFLPPVWSLHSSRAATASSQV